jgi:hypothetical protein
MSSSHCYRLAEHNPTCQSPTDPAFPFRDSIAPQTKLILLRRTSQLSSIIAADGVSRLLSPAHRRYVLSRRPVILSSFYDCINFHRSTFKPLGDIFPLSIIHILSTLITMSVDSPTSQNAPFNVKLLMLGQGSIGKSSLLLRFTDQQWLPEHETIATIGVDTWVNASIQLSTHLL